MEVKGKVVSIGQTESVGQNGFTKRLLILETLEQYPQKLPIDFVKEKTELLNSVTVGQEVTVSINLRGHEWTSPEGKVRNNCSIQGWKIQ